MSFGTKSSTGVAPIARMGTNWSPTMGVPARYGIAMWVARYGFRSAAGGSNRAARYVGSMASMAYFATNSKISLGAIQWWMEKPPLAGKSQQSGFQPPTDW